MRSWRMFLTILAVMVFLVGCPGEEQPVEMADTTAPVTGNDMAKTDRNQAVVIDVTANDTDTGGKIDPATLTVTSDPNNGTATVNTRTGTVTYTPADGFAGSDMLAYTVKDGAGNASNTATVSIEVVKPRLSFVTIGTGGVTGVYYPTGGAISRMINAKRKEYGLRASVESTGGSVFNVNAIMAGDLEFGIVQSDRQYQALHGLAEWQDKPQKDLRAVFSIHPESITLVATEESGIKTIGDLRGKRVNIGNPGSGQRQNAIDALEAMGIDVAKDIQAEGLKAAEAPGMLQDGRIDAFFYTVGHPSGAIKEATSGAKKVQLVAVAGAGIDALIEKSPYYAKAAVPVSFYPQAANTEDVPTFGVKATLVTSSKIPDEAVYAIVKEVFENFATFKTLHPAYMVLTKENMLEGLSAPLHPGAEKYYREAGLLK